MTVIELGALGEFIGSIVVMLTLIYLAVQVRQNTAQQKREETVSIQRTGLEAALRIGSKLVLASLLASKPGVLALAMFSDSSS